MVESVPLAGVSVGVCTGSWGVAQGLLGCCSWEVLGVLSCEVAEGFGDFSAVVV